MPIYSRPASAAAGSCASAPLPGDGNWKCDIAFARHNDSGERLLSVVDYAANQSPCYLRLTFADPTAATGACQTTSATSTTTATKRTRFPRPISRHVRLATLCFRASRIEKELKPSCNRRGENAGQREEH